LREQVKLVIFCLPGDDLLCCPPTLIAVHQSLTVLPPRAGQFASPRRIEDRLLCDRRSGLRSSRRGPCSFKVPKVRIIEVVLLWFLLRLFHLFLFVDGLHVDIHIWHLIQIG
jgi:hypothetical protein